MRVSRKGWSALATACLMAAAIGEHLTSNQKVRSWNNRLLASLEGKPPVRRGPTRDRCL